MSEQNKLIMIVDDDDDCRAVVQTILNNSGFHVEAFSNGADFLERLNTAEPAMVVLDIMMPEMSGYDVAVHMRQKPGTQNIPIMMLSAKSEHEDLLTGYNDYGVEYYVTKPFTTRQLLSGINIILGVVEEDKKEQMPNTPKA